VTFWRSFLFNHGFGNASLNNLDKKFLNFIFKNNNIFFMKREKSLYEMQAEMCKIFSSPKRVEILNVLRDGEKSVTDLVGILGSPKANISQHLSVMRLKGILKSRRDGVNIYYSIASPKVIQACDLMKEVLKELMLERSKVANLVIKG
jgi:ArsR family transcriptional regulator